MADHPKRSHAIEHLHREVEKDMQGFYSAFKHLPPGPATVVNGQVHSPPVFPPYTMHEARRLLAAEDERIRVLTEAAQRVTTECVDKIDFFEVPSHVMAALALALDELENRNG